MWYCLHKMTIANGGQRQTTCFYDKDLLIPCFLSPTSIPICLPMLVSIIYKLKENFVILQLIGIIVHKNLRNKDGSVHLQIF